MAKWKLYWVTNDFDRTEDCFVVAKTARSARSVEYSLYGEGFGDIHAEFVREIPDHIVENFDLHYKGYLKNKLNELNKELESERRDLKLNELEENIGKSWSAEMVWPNHADDWIYSLMGVECIYYNGRYSYKYNEEIYSIAAFEEVYGGGSESEKREEVIYSVSDFTSRVQFLNDARSWVYRGQRDAIWNLESGVERYNRKHAFPNGREHEERVLLEQFKLRAIPYLEFNRVPSSDWEWLCVGQHYGLPTRLLDWTKNPLYALFFAVWSSSEDRDGIVYAYHHGREPIDVSSNDDPMSIDRIEIFQPPHLSQRVALQNSIFTAEPVFKDIGEGWQSGSKLKKWFVPADCVKKIRQELEVMGVDESSLFPGLDSICSSIRSKMRI